MFFSVRKFKEELRSLLNQERITKLNTDVRISNTIDAMMLRVKSTL